MGRTTVNPETVEEGLRLCLGGKEIEVMRISSFCLFKTIGPE